MTEKTEEALRDDQGRQMPPGQQDLPGVPRADEAPQGEPENPSDVATGPVPPQWDVIELPPVPVVQDTGNPALDAQRWREARGHAMREALTLIEERYGAKIYARSEVVIRPE